MKVIFFKDTYHYYRWLYDHSITDPIQELVQEFLEIAKSARNWEELQLTVNNKTSLPTFNLYTPEILRGRRGKMRLKIVPNVTKENDNYAPLSTLRFVFMPEHDIKPSLVTKIFFTHICKKDTSPPDGKVRHGHEEEYWELDYPPPRK